MSPNSGMKSNTNNIVWGALFKSLHNSIFSLGFPHNKICMSCICREGGGGTSIGAGNPTKSNLTNVTSGARICFMNTNLWILPQTLSPYFCASMQYIQSVRNRNYFLSEKEPCLNQKLSRAQRISVMLENDAIQVIALSLPVPSFGWQLLNNFKGTQTLGRLHYWLPLFLESIEERERGGGGHGIVSKSFLIKVVWILNRCNEPCFLHLTPHSTSARPSAMQYPAIPHKTTPLHLEPVWSYGACPWHGRGPNTHYACQGL